MNNCPQFGRDFFAPIFLLLIAITWGIWDIAKSGPLQPFQWSNLIDPRAWLQPLTLSPLHAQPKTHLINPDAIVDIICLPDSDKCWAAGGNGFILHTDNGGQHWQAQISNTEEDLTSIYFSSPQEGWVVGDNGTILRTTNGGQRWQVQTSNTEEDLTRIYFSSSQEGWAVGWYGTILHTTSGGQEWQVQTSTTEEILSSIYFTDSEQGWAAGDNGTILHTTNGGQRWEAQASNTEEDLTRIYFTSPQEGWAVGYSGTILHTTDGGQNWQAQTSNTEEDLTSIYFTSPQEGWAVGKIGLILHTTNSGQRWEVKASNNDAILTSLYFASPDQGWAVGWDGTILHSTNGGRDWQAQTSNSEEEALYSIYFASSKQGWAFGDSGIILHTTNGGQDWKAQTSNTKESLTRIYFISPEQGWAVGGNGTILHTTNRGQEWQVQASATEEYLTSIHFASPEQGWAAGDNGTILHTTNGGQTWQAQTSNTEETLYSIYFISPEQGWAAGDNGTMLHSTNGGQTWQAQTSNTGEDLYSIYFTSPDQGWTVGDSGTMLHSTNRGQDWQAQTSATNAALIGIYFTTPSQGRVVGDNGTILHTLNGGKTWQSQTSNTEKILYGIYFTSSEEGWVVGDSGTILRTTNGGKEWSHAFRPDRKFYEQLRDKRFGNYHHWPSPLALILLLLSGAWLFVSLRTISNNPAAFLSNDHGGLADAPLQYADEDRLGYAPLARGIAKLIRNLDSKPPLAIAVSAPWGHGKSSVINMLREALATDAHTVQFNAWHYRDDSQILAALIEHIRDQAIPSSLSMANFMFRLRLLWRRVLQPTWRWWALVIPVCYLTLWYYGQRYDLDWSKALTQLHKQSHAWIDPIVNLVTGLPTGMPQVLVLLLLFLLGPKTLGKIAGPLKSFTTGEQTENLYSPLSKLKNHLQTTRKNWQDDTGLRFQFQRDFGDICYALGRDRLVILIDDLDRCDPDHIEQIISTLNFLFSNQNPCYVVIALDWNYVKTALGVAYENMAEALKAYEDPDADERENQQAFAESYLRKIIQLKVELPERNVVLAFAEDIAVTQEKNTNINYLKLFIQSIKFTWKQLTGSINSIKNYLTKNKTDSIIERKNSSKKTINKNWNLITIIFWPIKFILTLMEILVWSPIYKKLYRCTVSDAERLMNIVFVGGFSFILASLFTIVVVSIVPDQQIKTEPPENAISQKSSAPDIDPKDTEKKSSLEKIGNEEKSEPVIVLKPQNNSAEDLLPLIILFLSFPIIFWMAWFIRQERDSSSFSLALKDWKQQLAPQIKTPREWRRLENNLRFFIMLARSFDHANPWDKLSRTFEKVKNHLIAFADNQPYQAPRNITLDEGVATRLLMADIHFNGQIYTLLKDGLENKTFKGTLDRSRLYNQCNKIDPNLTVFFERLLDDKDIEAAEQVRLWLRLHSFKLQLPMNTNANDIEPIE